VARVFSPLRLPSMFVVGNNTAYNLNWFAGFDGLAGQDLGGFPVVQVVDQFGAPGGGLARQPFGKPARRGYV